MCLSADQFGLAKVVFMISIVLSGVFYFALLLVGEIQADTSSTFQVGSNQTCRNPRMLDKKILDRCNAFKDNFAHKIKLAANKRTFFLI